jgi:hypothetical protein
MKYKIVKKSNTNNTWYLLKRYYFFNLIPYYHSSPSSWPGDPSEPILFSSIDEVRREIVKIEKELASKITRTEILVVEESEVKKLIALNSFENT